MEITIGKVKWELEEHLGWTEVICCDWRAALAAVSVKCKIPAGGDIKGTAVIKTCELYFTQFICQAQHTSQTYTLKIYEQAGRHLVCVS